MLARLVADRPGVDCRVDALWIYPNRLSNQIIFIGLRSSKDYYKRPGGVAGVYGKGHLGVRFLRGWMCAEGMGCGRRWVIWVLRGTGTASWHPEVS